MPEDEEKNVWERTTDNQRFAINKLQEELETTIEEWEGIFGGGFTNPTHDMASWIVNQVTKVYGKRIE